MSDMVEHIEFEAGDPVPEWLLYSEPSAPDSEPGTMTFCQSVEIIDAGKYYRVEVSDDTCPTFRIDNATDRTLWATTKPVAFPGHFTMGVKVVN